MVHLAIHLPHEVELGGPVQYRWMYFIERLLRTLKDFVRNKARPEGSIAEAYIAKECLSFCSMYFHGIETRFNREDRNCDGSTADMSTGFLVLKQKARTLGAAKYEILSTSEKDSIHWYILNNCNEINVYRNLHKEELAREDSVDVERRHQKEFGSWFKTHVTRLRLNCSLGSSDHLYILGIGPDVRIAKYNGLIVNGIRFHTLDRDKTLQTQNSGVVVKGEHNLEEIDFYGVIMDIIELQYCNMNRVFMFKCIWWNVGDKRNGIWTDGILVSVNTSRKWYMDDAFVLATQVEQVFYVNDIKRGGSWQIVQRAHSRNLYDIPEIDHGADYEELSPIEEPYQQDQTGTIIHIVQEDDHMGEPLHREDALYANVDATTVLLQVEDSNLDDDIIEQGDDTINEYIDDSSEEDFDDDDGGGGDDDDDDVVDKEI